jgi:hypothetical protein
MRSGDGSSSAYLSQAAFVVGSAPDLADAAMAGGGSFVSSHHEECSQNADNSTG